MGAQGPSLDRLREIPLLSAHQLSRCESTILTQVLGGRQLFLQITDKESELHLTLLSGWNGETGVYQVCLTPNFWLSPLHIIPKKSLGSSANTVRAVWENKGST